VCLQSRNNSTPPGSFTATAYVVCCYRFCSSSCQKNCLACPCPACTATKPPYEKQGLLAHGPHFVRQNTSLHFAVIVTRPVMVALHCLIVGRCGALALPHAYCPAAAVAAADDPAAAAAAALGPVVAAAAAAAVAAAAGPAAAAVVPGASSAPARCRTACRLRGNALGVSHCPPYTSCFCGRRSHASGCHMSCPGWGSRPMERWAQGLWW